MKKIAIFIMALIGALSLCACACGNMNPATTPTTINPTTNTPTTNNTIMPTENMTVPVPETNIPDPEVNSNSTDDGINDPTNGRSRFGGVGNYGIQ